MNQPYYSAVFPIPRHAIAQLVPFGPAWLMVDEVSALMPNRIQTRKLLAADDPYIAGHFARGPTILPGVLLIEFVSQSAYLHGVLSAPATGAAEPRLLARCNASFLSPARAGEALTADVELLDCVNGVTMYEATVSCGSRTICRAKVFGAPTPAWEALP